MHKTDLKIVGVLAGDRGGQDHDVGFPIAKELYQGQRRVGGHQRQQKRGDNVFSSWANSSGIQSGVAGEKIHAPSGATDGTGTPLRPGWFFLDKILGGRKGKVVKSAQSRNATNENSPQFQLRVPRTKWNESRRDGRRWRAFFRPVFCRPSGA